MYCFPTAPPVAKIKKQAEKNVVPVVEKVERKDLSIQSADPPQQPVVKEATMVKKLRQGKKDEDIQI